MNQQLQYLVNSGAANSDDEESNQNLYFVHQDVKVKEAEVIDWERKLAAPMKRRKKLEVEIR